MKRLIKENINTKSYWGEQYSNGYYQFPGDIIKFIAMSYFIEDGSTVADFGCGNMEFLNKVEEFKTKCRLIGIDHARCSSQGNVHFIDSDVTRTPLKENTIDYVVSFETLEHITRPQELIDEMYRVLKPGGKLMLTTPYLDHIPSQEHVWEFDYKDLEDMLSKFTNKWVFPWASGRGVINEDRSNKYLSGNWDDIFALAIK
jgi:ubiquinone/menaquinone biosynthesis C-methylase UbiE